MAAVAPILDSWTRKGSAPVSVHATSAGSDMMNEVVFESEARQLIVPTTGRRTSVHSVTVGATFA